jgi:hypothetical protein
MVVPRSSIVLRSSLLLDGFFVVIGIGKVVFVLSGFVGHLQHFINRAMFVVVVSYVLTSCVLRVGLAVPTILFYQILPS